VGQYHRGGEIASELHAIVGGSPIGASIRAGCSREAERITRVPWRAQPIDSG
jgi:hypothetical protein